MTVSQGTGDQHSLDGYDTLHTHSGPSRWLSAGAWTLGLLFLCDSRPVSTIHRRMRPFIRGSPTWAEPRLALPQSLHHCTELELGTQRVLLGSLSLESLLLRLGVSGRFDFGLVFGIKQTSGDRKYSTWYLLKHLPIRRSKITVVCHIKKIERIGGSRPRPKVKR
jgi:hypothetical protein